MAENFEGNESLDDLDAGSSPDAPDPVEKLLGRVRAGDREAAAEFVRRYWPRVRRRIRRRLGRQMRRLYDSDDIFATVNRRFDRLVEAKGVRAVSQEELASLVQHIINGAVADKARDFARLTRLERADSGYANWLQSNPRTNPAQARGEIERLVELLDDEIDKQILTMRLNGSRFDEISRAMELSPTGVRKRWQHIRERLRLAGDCGPTVGEDVPD